MLSTCIQVTRAGAAVALDGPARERLKSLFREQGSPGFRVLAWATRSAEPRDAYTRNEEAAMCCAGFLWFTNPPKDAVKGTLATLACPRIAIEGVTADNHYVAAHVAGRVAGRVGLDAQALLAGEQIDALTDEALWHHALRTVLFVEADPQLKEHTLRALEHRGHAVARQSVSKP